LNDAGGGYFTDIAPLDRMVASKLEEAAQAVRAEGWAWVMVTPEFDHRAVSDMRRVYPTAPTISDKTQRKLDKLTSEYDELVAAAEIAKRKPPRASWPASVNLTPTSKRSRARS
jgi:ParB family transcriptional regulator, chromosome partitioning protein